MNKKRNSNIELLRLISIIMIIISHYSFHGSGKIVSDLSLGINRLLLEVITLGNIGSILFVLISGYYLVNSKEVKLKKIIRLMFQISFYSIVIYVFLCAFSLESFTIVNLVKSIFPISFKIYWFATAYIVLYLFHPYINKLLNNFSRKEHLVFMTYMFILFSILHTITTGDYFGNELIQFLLFYSIGAYLSKYPDNILKDNNNNYKLFVISSLLIIISIIFLDILGMYKSVFGKHSIYLLGRTSPFAILLSVSLFDIFARKKTYENKYINYISSLIFGVYLISDNPYMRSIIWVDIFKNATYVNSPYLFLHIIVTITLVIVVCLIIEIIRKSIFDNLIYCRLDKYLDKIEDKIKLFTNTLIKMK